MTAPGASRGGPSRASGGSSGFKGAVLVGLAVIAGIVGLQIVDDSGNSTSTNVAATNATTAPGSVTTTVAVRPPNEVRVKVYNASGVLGVAQTMTDTLQAKGYNMQAPATITKTRAGTAVQCLAGFEGEAAQLAAAIANGTPVEPYPSSPPDGADTADCLVIIGTT